MKSKNIANPILDLLMAGNRKNKLRFKNNSKQTKGKSSRKQVIFKTITYKIPAAYSRDGELIREETTATRRVRLATIIHEKLLVS